MGKAKQNWSMKGKWHSGECMNSINECNANERIHRRTEINIVNMNSCRRHTGQGVPRKCTLKQWSPANDLQSSPIHGKIRQMGWKNTPYYFFCFPFPTYILLKSSSIHWLPVNKSAIHFLKSEWCISHLSVKLVFPHFQGIFMSWYTTLISI